MHRGANQLYGVAILLAPAERLDAIIGLVAIGIAPAFNAHFMVFAAGEMAFVSIHELIPMARRYRHMGLLVGSACSAPVYWLLCKFSVGAAVAL